MTALLLAACLLQQRVETDAGCIKCHEGQSDDWKGSVHEKNGIGCVRCHGADSVANQSKPHLFTAGFRRGTKKTNPTVCGACHQLDLAAYDKSAHAEDTRDSEGKVKGCSSCHAWHETGIADRRVILKDACATCHKPGSAKHRSGEEYIAFAETLHGDELKIVRVAQHTAHWEIFVQPGAYNTKDSPPAWAVAMAVFAVLGAALAWFHRPIGRKA